MAVITRSYQIQAKTDLRSEGATEERRQESLEDIDHNGSLSDE